MDARERTPNSKPNGPADPEKQASVLFTFMISNSDCTEWKINKLNKVLKGQINDVLKLAKRFPHIFDLSKGKGLVDLKCPLDVCTSHWSSNGCSTSGCRNLHICKFYVTGQCPSTNCKFGHQFRSAHNSSLLRECRLESLNNDQLGKLIKNAEAFKDEGLPPICTYHNSRPGCRKGDNCPFMHVCDRYLRTNTCTFSDDACRNSHDLTQPQTQQILAKYGYDLTQGNEAAILQRLRRKYDPSKAAGSERPPSGRQREQAMPVLPCLPLDDGWKRDGYVKTRRDRSASAGSAKPRGPGNKENRGKNPPHSARQRPDSRTRQPPRQAPSTQALSSKPPAPPKAAGPPVVRTQSVQGDEICTFHLRNKCKYQAKCQKVHVELPYQWQFQDKGRWLPFGEEANGQLEKAFCQVEGEGATVAMSDLSISMEVDFLSMTYQGFGRGEVRRLSTESWGQAFKNRPFITKWQWFFLDERNKWKEYSNSMEIEEEFLKGESDVFEFQVRHHHYELHFKQMYQKNKKFETERDVRRRPKLYKKPENATASSGTRGEEQSSESENLPESWCTGSATAADYELKLVDLPSSSPEYRAVAKRFSETMSDPVKRVTRIQNFDLWEFYAETKRRMLKKTQGSTSSKSSAAKTSSTDLCQELNEQLLFHGTRKQYIEPIYTYRGFDFRNAGSSVGTLYGKGNYFARDASYSRSYTDCRQLFVVKVLVGKVAKGGSTLTKPPPLDAAVPHGRLFDCCVDDVANPSIFVTFDNGQAYPAYIIEY